MKDLILNKNQYIKKERNNLIVEISHNDRCGNGHNTFRITGTKYSSARRTDRAVECCGSIHDEITKEFPELEPFIKWHGCTTAGPPHYIANTTYHAKPISKYQDKYYFYLENTLIKIVDKGEKSEMLIRYGTNGEFKPYYNTMAKKANLTSARSTAIWPDATLGQLQSEEKLLARLPALMADFQKAVESLGLIY